MRYFGVFSTLISFRKTVEGEFEGGSVERECVFGVKEVYKLNIHFRFLTKGSKISIFVSIFMLNFMEQR